MRFLLTTPFNLNQIKYTPSAHIFIFSLFQPLVGQGVFNKVNGPRGVILTPGTKRGFSSTEMPLKSFNLSNILPWTLLNLFQQLKCFKTFQGIWFLVVCCRWYVRKSIEIRIFRKSCFSLFFSKTYINLSLKQINTCKQSILMIQNQKYE